MRNAFGQAFWRNPLIMNQSRESFAGRFLIACVRAKSAWQPVRLSKIAATSVSRRRAGWELNQGEASHDLSRFLCFGEGLNGGFPMYMVNTRTSVFVLTWSLSLDE